MPSSHSSEAIDVSRISITGHLTSSIWYEAGLSDRAFTTWQGRLGYAILGPILRWAQKRSGSSDFRIVCLQRHRIIDHLLERAIEEQGVLQVVELAAGLSSRGQRFMKRYAERGLRYIEADLEGMVKRKREMLDRAGLSHPGHVVTECNILERSGAHSLAKMAKQELDPSVPTTFITEGLINYFPMSDVLSLWSQISEVLNETGVGIYLSDNMPDPGEGTGDRNSRYFRKAVRFLGWLTKGKFELHFCSAEETKDALLKAGFRGAEIYVPESFAGQLDMPLSRKPSFLRVIAASA